jgi:hypothetical protein
MAHFITEQPPPGGNKTGSPPAFLTREINAWERKTSGLEGRIREETGLGPFSLKLVVIPMSVDTKIL